MPVPQNSHKNRLANESSPYLLQHAHNPVDWYPWGDEAFEKARKEDKPVFVSIGYATCHWCHVMAHESFEDEKVAALLNKTFVNIKVDKEERPDLDNTYMLVCQMLTGNGGWPLNVFLTPEKKPFYAATYIPKRGRQGLPGLLELIPWISNLWQNEREKIKASTDEIIRAFQNSTSFKSGDRLTIDVLDQAFDLYHKQFDRKNGGFGTAPKFPSPHNLMLLLRYAQRTDNANAVSMVEQTLTKMRYGGIFDHIGFGFHRYSTDQQWLVPHFEKMLYDQAMLLMAYSECWQCTNNELLKRTAKEITAYLFRKMHHPEGGFFSAEDADSEGEEGKFYVWTIAEIRNQLPPAEAELMIEVYNLTREGNYRDESSGRRTGKNIPHLTKPLSTLAEERGMSTSKLSALLEQIRQKLLDRRKQRAHPLLDDKILTDWNGLTIAALAKSGSILNNDDYIRQARRCWTFIQTNLITDKKLKHRFRNGETAIDAHADDYAFLILGLIELYKATLESDFLQQAIHLNDQFMDHFWDDEKGGFFFTPESGEQLLGRKKEIYDAAIPSSNSVGILNLLQLGRITGNTDWEDKSEQMNRLFATDIRNSPTNFGFALQAVEFSEGNTKEVVIVGPKGHSATQTMIKKIKNQFSPNVVLLLKEPGDNLISSLAPYLSDFNMINDKPTAYICQNYKCERPTTDPQEMMRLLNASPTL